MLNDKKSKDRTTLVQEACSVYRVQGEERWEHCTTIYIYIHIHTRYICGTVAANRNKLRSAAHVSHSTFTFNAPTPSSPPQKECVVLHSSMLWGAGP